MKKILVISTTGMGDCLWGTPGIRALKQAFPAAEVDLLVNWMWKPLFEGNPYLNEIFEYHSEWYLQPILGVQLFNRHYYDAIFIFHANKNFRRMLPWFRSSPIWCHQKHLWVPEIGRVNIEDTIHGIQRRLVMLEKFGVKSDGGQMEIFFDPATLKKSEQILQSHGFNSREYVYLNLGAAVESRRWMVDRFIELAKRILQSTSKSIILGGGSREKKSALEILNHFKIPRLMEVCSHPIRINASIISKAKLMVTSDTGPMHIGFATKTPVVALFGTISPIGSGPHNIPDCLCRVVTVDPKLDSAKKTDSSKFNFTSITVNMVWKQVEKIIAENSSSY
jgi:ADP-heptose:LPS heptosyltransferase